LPPLPDIPSHRPDLLALRYGYQAADADLRAAILAQFPRLSLGLTGGADTSDVRTLGPQITLDLPVFDRNQGAIAIARASRRKLRAEYIARLQTAEGEVRALEAELRLTARQLRRAHTQLQRATVIAAAATRAWRAGNLSERAYVDFITARIDAERQTLALRQTLLDQRIALATLTGAGMPRMQVRA
jgi:outer membrane protein TolC